MQRWHGMAPLALWWLHCSCVELTTYVPLMQGRPSSSRTVMAALLLYIGGCGTLHSSVAVALSPQLVSATPLCVDDITLPLVDVSHGHWVLMTVLSSRMA